MSKDLESLVNLRRMPADRPLLGLTILLVEDSRFASEAVRLLCQRSGARLRRADCLRSARRHLLAYRPTVAIVDLGLPDGPGEELIAELAAATPRLPVILATSGDSEGEAAALAAGADAFIAKPLESLSYFQSLILSALGTPGLRLLAKETGERLAPDRLALRDDLAQAADGLKDGRDIIYLARFLGGVARSAYDVPLADAAHDLACRRDPIPITRLIQDRLESGCRF